MQIYGKKGPTGSGGSPRSVQYSNFIQKERLAVSKLEKFYETRRAAPPPLSRTPDNPED